MDEKETVLTSRKSRFRWVICPDCEENVGQHMGIFATKITLLYKDRIIRGVFAEVGDYVRKWINGRLNRTFDILLVFYDGKGKEIDSCVFKNAKIESHQMLLDYSDSSILENLIEFKYDYVMDR